MIFAFLFAVLIIFWGVAAFVGVIVDMIEKWGRDGSLD